jgi:hypothetical protein
MHGRGIQLGSVNAFSYREKSNFLIVHIISCSMPGSTAAGSRMMAPNLALLSSDQVP